MYPKPTDVARLRTHLGVTQAGAGRLAGVAERTFQDWERGVAEMPVGLWELLLIKAGVLVAEPYGRPVPAALRQLGRELRAKQ
jgi:DNA-binding XRE family transcriptional regulator